jgi:hypothetical protein
LCHKTKSDIRFLVVNKSESHRFVFFFFEENKSSQQMYRTATVIGITMDVLYCYGTNNCNRSVVITLTKGL